MTTQLRQRSCKTTRERKRSSAANPAFDNPKSCEHRRRELSFEPPYRRQELGEGTCTTSWLHVQKTVTQAA
jgi:hypothetical protein